MECIFCKIVAGELPTNKIYEDEKYLAFLDINPVNAGHTLVIPKEHYVDVLSTPDEVLLGLIHAVKKVAAAVVAGLGVPGFNIGVNNGRVAGQIVDHVHFHVMPRREDDGHKLWHGKAYVEGEAAVTAEKIRAALK